MPNKILMDKSSHALFLSQISCFAQKYHHITIFWVSKMAAGYKSIIVIANKFKFVFQVICVFSKRIQELCVLWSGKTHQMLLLLIWNIF